MIYIKKYRVYRTLPVKILICFQNLNFARTFSPCVLADVQVAHLLPSTRGEEFGLHICSKVLCIFKKTNKTHLVANREERLEVKYPIQCKACLHAALHLFNFQKAFQFGFVCFVFFFYQLSYINTKILGNLDTGLHMSSSANANTTVSEPLQQLCSRVG